MEIRHDPAAMRFEAMEGETCKGVLRYTREADSWVDACSTKVPPEFGGQGIARLLLEALTDWARAEGLKIRPTCSYVARAFDREPGRYGDLKL